jgi:hypothetical protein
MVLPEGLSPQYKALVVIPCITGSISFVSSAIMTYMIWSDRKETRNRSKNSLLLGLCISDLFLSSAYACSTFLGPLYLVKFIESDVGVGLGSTLVGTDFSCSLQASFSQLGLCQPSYNAALCLYYLLIIRFNKTDLQLRKWVLPAMHVIIISFNVVGVIVGVSLDAFHYAGSLGCYFQDPCHGDMPDCPTDSPPDYDLLVFIFIALPVIVDFLIVVLGMTTIYLSLRKVERKAKRWSYEEAMKNHHPSSLAGPSLRSNDDFSPVEELEKCHDRNETRTQLDSSDSRTTSALESKTRRREKTISRGARDIGLQYGMLFFLSLLRDCSRLVLTLYLYSLLPVISFLVTYVPLGVSAVVLVGWVRVVMVIFTPLQGFWNFVFFLRDRVYHLHKRHPDEKLTWKIWASIAAFPKYAR